METLIQKKEIDILENFSWEIFFKDYWDKYPVLIKKPFAETIISKSDLLLLFQLQTKKILSGKTAELTFYDKHRVSLSGTTASKRYLTGMEPYLPGSDWQDLDSYLKWLATHKRYEEFCIYVNSPHTHQHIWEKMRAYFKVIFESTPMSPAGMNTDIFIGNYKKTNFGAHKDQLSNFMFMVFGCRRMLLWSDDVWKRQLKNPNDDKFVLQDYEIFRTESIEVNLEPGDLLYWPSEYWHVGENDGNLSGSINIDYVQPSLAIDLDTVLQNAVSKIAKQESKKHRKNHDLDFYRFQPNADGQMDIPNNLVTRYEFLVDNFDDNRIYRFFLESEWLRKLSAMGFNKALSIREPVELTSDTIIYSDSDFPILYKPMDEKVIISHSGALLLVNFHPMLFRLISKINTGIMVSLKELFSLTVEDQMSWDAFVEYIKHFYCVHAIQEDIQKLQITG